MAETLSGIGVSPGVAAGPVAQMAPPPVVPTDATPSGDPEAENQAAMDAMRAVAHGLEERASRAPGEAASVPVRLPSGSEAELVTGLERGHRIEYLIDKGVKFSAAITDAIGTSAPRTSRDVVPITPQVSTSVGKLAASSPWWPISISFQPREARSR